MVQIKYTSETMFHPWIESFVKSRKKFQVPALRTGLRVKKTLPRGYTLLGSESAIATGKGLQNDVRASERQGAKNGKDGRERNISPRQQTEPEPEHVLVGTSDRVPRSISSMSLLFCCCCFWLILWPSKTRKAWATRCLTQLEHASLNSRYWNVAVVFVVAFVRRRRWLGWRRHDGRKKEGGKKAWLGGHKLG